MELVFKKYEAKDEWTTLGTLKEIAGKGGKIGFIKPNFRNAAKNVAVLIERKDGTSTVISCHKDLSPKVRAGELTLKHLAGLSVIGIGEGEEAVILLVLPGTGGTQMFEVDKIKAVAVEEETAEFLPEELIAF